MAIHLTRRAVLAGLAAPVILRTVPASAATLDELRSAGVIRIGLANQPPYSGLNPDGTISGFVPTLVQRVMASLGVETVEPFVATYGELIPGLQAGRWQMIAASFRLTTERCEQVLFTDPVTFDGGAMAYLEGMEGAPSTLEELAASDLRVGVLQGSYLVERVGSLGVPDDRLSQFPNNPALIDGLIAQRADVVVTTNASLRQLQAQRGGFDIVYPLPEDPPVGSAPAFSREDGELHAAFQEELRALRSSGEMQELASEFGFDPPPEDLLGISAEDACARL